VGDFAVEIARPDKVESFTITLDTQGLITKQIDVTSRPMMRRDHRRSTARSPAGHASAPADSDHLLSESPHDGIWFRPPDPDRLVLGSSRGQGQRHTAQHRRPSSLT